MSSVALPKTPIENWEQVRDEWISAVDQLLRDAEQWSRKQDWATRRDPKTITEDENGIGVYTVPRLLIHTIDGRLLLDPIARFVVGANGLVELCAMPSYDWARIVRTEKGWQLYTDKPDWVPQPWSEQVFLDTVRELILESKR